MQTIVRYMRVRSMNRRCSGGNYAGFLHRGVSLRQVIGRDRVMCNGKEEIVGYDFLWDPATKHTFFSDASTNRQLSAVPISEECQIRTHFVGIDRPVTLIQVFQ